MRNKTCRKRRTLLCLLLTATVYPLSAEPADAGFELKLYGFIRSHYAGANHAVLSFGSESLIQPNQAKRATQVDDGSQRSEIVYQESRFGITPMLGDRVKGVYEFDLANGGVRPRKAAVEFKLGEASTVFFGQMGDIFSPLGPHLYNIAWMLQQGNVGDRRPQAGFGMKLSDAFSLKAAIGNTASSNSGLSTLNGSPSGAIQLKLSPASGFDLYISAIAASVKHGHALIDPAYFDSVTRAPVDPATDPSVYAAPYLQHGGQPVRRESNAIALGIDTKLGNNVSIVAEGYYGRNMAHLGVAGLDAGGVQVRTLASQMKDQLLGYVTNTGDANANGLINGMNSSTLLQFASIREAGGFVSADIGLGEAWNLQIFGGGAKVLNPEDLNSNSSTPADLARWQGPTETASPGAAKENRSAGWSLSWKPAGLKGLTLFLEHQYFDTLYHDGAKISMYRNIDHIDLAAAGNPIVTVPLSSTVTDASLPHYHALANTLRFGANYAF